jgi:hypothetical protein
MTKIAIVHFQPLEKYPPVMNLINSICLMESVSCNVYTTLHKNNDWFNSDKIKIYRISKQYLISLLRYWGYIKFNCWVLFRLLFLQPNIIYAFETYSLLPVYFYKKIYKKTKLHIHYHEYTSPLEIEQSSYYFKFLHMIEKKLFITCNSISQTNEDRMKLFLNDYPFINSSKTVIASNIPPRNWFEFPKLHKKINTTGITRLVHVGALSLETMYIEKIVEWVIAQNGLYTLDLYTDNCSVNARKYIEGLNNKDIKLLGSINYYHLPNVLINYDIGLTLYNGHIPNYIYNVPNKVYEYLACGLEVWYSKDLISTDKLNNLNEIYNYSEVPDFLKKLKIQFELTKCNSLINIITNYY